MKQLLILMLLLLVFMTACGNSSNKSSSEQSTSSEIISNISQNRMTLILDGDFIRLSLAGSGDVTVDWGDGEEPDRSELSSNRKDFRKKYNAPAIYEVTIMGEGITYLSCWDNKISQVDVSRNVSLQTLYLSQNNISEINLKNNPALELLSLGNNSIKTLDLTNNKELREVNLGHNQLSSLNILQNTGLQELDIRDNQLTSLDCSNNIILWSLTLSNNLFSAKSLEDLFLRLHDGKETEKFIDISGNPGSFECDTSIAKAKGWDLIGDTHMILTTDAQNVKFSIFAYGSWEAKIDWDDGSSHELVHLSDFYSEKERQYSESKRRNIYIIDPIEGLNCQNNQLTSLQVNRNIGLDRLDCSDNQLTSLDLSKNIYLTYIDLSNNLLTTEALNNIFRSLHDRDIEKYYYESEDTFIADKTIKITNNPGSANCDTFIAVSRGWSVINE